MTTRRPAAGLEEGDRLARSDSGDHAPPAVTMQTTRADETTSAKRRSRGWLRVLAKHRGWRRALVLVLPAVLIVSSDILMRGNRLTAFSAKYLGSYGFAIVESTILWGVLLGCASARRGWLRWAAATVFVFLATLSIGTQIYFYRQYSTYLNLDATLWARTMGDSVFGQLSADGPHVASSVAPPMLIALLLVALGRRLVRTRRRTANILGALAPVAVLGALLIPCSYRSVQGSTPDVIYFHAIGGLAKQLTGIEERRDHRPKRRTPPPMPKLEAKPSMPRNVLFILTESIRADLACSSPVPSCEVMPFTNNIAPRRHGFLQMRSNSSTTAIQLAVLWSGLQPNAGREPLHSAPVLFDYAHAAGIDTAYWSSHHMMFANSRLFVQDLPTTFQCGATNLNSTADIDVGADDRLLTARVKQQIASLQEPFFAVAHYGNTHVPYLVDDADAPFQPALASKASADTEAYHRYYKNAVHRQDKTIAELIAHVRSLPLSEQTVIFYTADHGEQFREHGQLGHTGSLFDVEIHVPAWIDAPEGTLTASERTAITSHEEEFTFHTDVTPTLLDLMGLWNEPQLSEFTKSMVGQSLLRSPEEERTLAMTNCSGVWGCAFENWGVMRGPLKVISREWDNAWLCFDVTQDQPELSPLHNDQCDQLRTEANQIFGALPGKQ